MTLAFTEALAVGLPVVALRSPRVQDRALIDGNGLCSNNVDEISQFLSCCLDDYDFAKSYGMQQKR